MAKTKEQYIIVYDWMTVNLGLSGNERMIYALFYGNCKDGEWCTVSQESIAKRLGASVVGINKAIISLISKGYIKREEVIGKHGTTYRYMILVNQKTPKQSLPLNKVYPQTKLGSTPKQSWGVTPKQSLGNNKDNNKYNINTTTTNAHTHDRLQDEIDEMRGDMIWLEPICMKHHIQLS
jgi:predicted transcriptional regulator